MRKSQEPKQEEKKPNTTSTSPSITTSVDSVEKTCSKQTTVSKTVSVQNEIEKEIKDTTNSQELKEKDCPKLKIEVKKSKQLVLQPQPTKDSEEKKTIPKIVEKKEQKESKTIKKMSLEKIAGREEDVRCDKEVSQKAEESERILHFSKKKGPEKNEDKSELQLEPTPLSWNNEA
ncbi:hypothetical protein CRE_23903 [Caenorhabditis remanei]|uniref:Uncharacterized protein n=1 Tax=Caenorhabditis remanei TaxID=31234 RepID=E3MGD1_CAERE|nr:hypothetical protein CRE_23903 [Caenorhabditis remanei]